MGWPERAAWLWALAFALLFMLTFEANRLLDDWVSFVDSRVSYVFLPAFVRVAAVLVAGLAGALGVFLGSCLIGLLYEQPLGLAVGHAFISALAPCLALYLLRMAVQRSQNSFDLLTLLVLALFTSLISAITHGLFWAFFDADIFQPGVDLVGVMIVGDFLGVLLGFFLLRALLQSFRRIGFTRHSRPG